uniref:Somatomedin-B and thrombospondin type-1 domain-containing protein-like n=1 Tax=Cyanistes caeruleus TaxID=156563 RepID=A0A8C0UHZ7_CYACU
PRRPSLALGLRPRAWAPAGSAGLVGKWRSLEEKCRECPGRLWDKSEIRRVAVSYVKKCTFWSRHFTVIPCVVSQWSAWSGCAEPCKTTYRVRTRHIIQEPRNGAEACPALEERAGCVEYWTRQGTECQQSLIPALITKGGFGKARKKRAPADGSERAGYCVEFQLVALTPGCLHSQHSHTSWTRYLREGHRVCVECQHPALQPPRQRCYGDGAGSQQNQLLHWQAVGNDRCKGTWRRIRQLDTCSCPSVHSFLFI